MWYVQFRKVGKMSHHENNYYNQTYYQTHCGEEYERGNGWEEVFACYAQRIIREICPHSVLDVGCAKGFLVEALRDQGMEAFGIDISEYAVASVRKDIRPFCKVQSVLHPIEGHYDLLTCIEVLEHLDQAEIALAIQHLCAASDDILLSSTPFDYDEESHVSVHTPAYWAEQFAYHGFYHDVRYDCSYISIQAMRFRKGKKSKAELIREYEDELFQKHQELVAAKVRYQTSKENVEIYKDAYQKHVDQINQELNPQILKLEALLGEKEAEKEKEKENLLKVQRVRAAECVQKRLDEEVEKRRALEEENSRLHQKLEETVGELARAAEDAAFLEQAAYPKGQLEVTLTGLIKQYFRKKREERMLFKKKMEYFKPVFDPVYYALHNEDISKVLGMDEGALFRHFIVYGMDEGRRANEDFDVRAYAKYNRDVLQAQEWRWRGCYLHYIEYGKKEGRRVR